jgi:hypothetical protein
LLPVALVLELLPHVSHHATAARSRVLWLLTLLHASQMHVILSASPCAVLWLVSGTTAQYFHLPLPMTSTRDLLQALV